MGRGSGSSKRRGAGNERLVKAVMNQGGKVGIGRRKTREEGEGDGVVSIDGENMGEVS